MLLMLLMNVDLFAVVRFPFWHRIHFHARLALSTSAAFAFSTAVYVVALGFVCEDLKHNWGAVFDLYPSIFLSGIATDTNDATSLLVPLVVISGSLAVPVVLGVLLNLLIYAQLRRRTRTLLELGVRSLNQDSRIIAESRRKRTRSANMENIEMGIICSGKVKLSLSHFMRFDNLNNKIYLINYSWICSIFDHGS